MDIKAFKMDGLGNDFVIIDNREKITNLTKDQIVKICDRNFIGCDQLIFIESDSSADANLRFFNSANLPRYCKLMLESYPKKSGVQTAPNLFATN